MDFTNEMVLEFDSKSINESFARTVVASFIAQLDPTLEEFNDVKTAVSEAVTNSIIHGYKDDKGKIKIICIIKGQEIYIEVEDQGVGIEDIKKSMEPFYTSSPEEERSGMGFTFMEAFMDDLIVESEVGRGTIVKMAKKLDKILEKFEVEEQD